MLEECGFGSEATVLAVVENALQTGQVCQGSTQVAGLPHVRSQRILNAAENAPVMRLAKELASQPVQGVGEHNAFMQDWICPRQVREAVREGF